MNAIETVYRQTKYRSRLEARWAAFFDLAGWRYEYEPYDLNGWIPDFALLGTRRWSAESEPEEKEAVEILVEVKPFLRLSEFNTEKILNAMRGTEKWGTEILLLGPSLCWETTSSGLAIGWLGEFMEGAYCFASAPFVWPMQGKSSLGFCHMDWSWHNRISGEYTGDILLTSPDEIKMFWNQAGNAVQWHPGGVK